MLVLPPRPPKGVPLGQQLAGGAAAGLINVGSQLAQRKQMEQAAKQENETLKRLGIDAEGLSPEIRKVVVAEALKSQGKEKLLGQKQGFLDQLFGGQQEAPGMISEEPLGQMQQGSEMGGFDPASIPDEAIVKAAALDPVLGRELRAAKNASIEHGLRKEKLALEKKKTSPEYLRESHVETAQANADVKYNQTLQEASKQHELKEQSLNRLEQLNKKGVTGKPYEKLLEKVGLVSLTSEGRREFAADVKNLITDIRSILGAQFTGFEFQTILNAYPSADFSKEANASIIKNLKDFQDIKKKEVEFADQLKKENKGKIPYDFQSQVNEKVRQYAASKLPEIKQNTQEIMNAQYGIPKGHTLLLDRNGEILSVPDSEIDAALELGAEFP